MRKTMIATALFAGGVGVLAIGAAPAFAGTDSATPVTVLVTGGSLSISAPTVSVPLGSVPGSTSAQIVSASLGSVAVTDGRAGIAGWVATVQAPAFSGAGTISTTTAGSVTYTPGTATVTGVAVVTPTTEQQLEAVGPVQTATVVVGVNTATWNPTIAVTVPAGAVAGTYGTTITHSVS